MGRVGIMLAAGEATRLPNKALLPQKGTGIIIESGLNMLKRSGCDEIIVVIAPNSMLPTVLESRAVFVKYVWQSQDRPGVIGALREGFAKVGDKHDEVIVTFCDNVFTRAEVVPPFNYSYEHTKRSIASVRMLADEDQLDWYDVTTGKWMARSYPGVKPRATFAGWLGLDHETAKSDLSKYNTLIDFMNGASIKPHRVDKPWADCGTEHSYLKYLGSWK